MAQALDDLAAARVSVWLDDLSRPRILTGSLARMVDGGEIVGITTNPTIFAKAIGKEAPAPASGPQSTFGTIYRARCRGEDRSVAIIFPST
jgi:hypothetical protein